MPAVLVISRDKVQMEKAVMDGARFTIGRSSRCSLQLNDNMLSREHCSITEENDTFRLMDNGSRNGVEHNGSAISDPVNLQDGDRIGIGPFELVFYSSDSADIGFDESDQDDKTRFAGAELPALKDSKKKKSGKEVAGGSIVKVAITSGPLKGETYKEWTGNLNIGRGADNEIVLPDDAASTAHARLFREGNQYWIEDFNSANGTFVENIRMHDKQVLKNGDKIRIGTTVLEYSQVDPAQIRAMRKRIMLTTVAVVFVLVVMKVFQPEDKTIRYMQGANQLFERGEYSDAIALYNKVLELDPANQAARAGISSAKSQSEAAKVLLQAKDAALHEKYTEALDMCHRVLRLHPSHEEAKELLEVVKMIEESKVATDAHNWPDAIDLIEKALKSYPGSDVLQTGLTRARSEAAAQTNLQFVAELIEDTRFREAREALETISSNSTYAAEATKIMTKIGRLEKADAALQQANQAFEAGNVEAAYKQIAVGMAAYPGYVPLKKFKRDLDVIAEPIIALDSAASLVNSEDVLPIRSMIRTCESIMNIRFESEEIAEIRSRAAELVEELNDRLMVISTESMAAGRRALEAYDKRTALQQFIRASQADPGNEEAADEVRNIQRVLLPIAKDHYSQAIVHEELEQVDLAIAEYEKVLEISIPGDRYYDRAKLKLKRLKN